MIGGALYPCNAAKGVFARSNMELCLVSSMSSQKAAQSVQARLAAFGQRNHEGLASFIVLFNDQPIRCEHHYEALLWSFLQRIHELDAPLYAWDEAVSSDPNDPHFSFSVGGKAYYLIGFHPHSSRQARQFRVPMIIFNPHQQFEALRQSGKYSRLRDTIRANDIRYSGSVNPMLRDFGSASETRQYSGQAQGKGWRCPLQIKTV